MVFQLTQKLVFPDPHYGEPDGLLAVGGDLSVDRLLLAYSNGIFPWYTFHPLTLSVGFQTDNQSRFLPTSEMFVPDR